MTAEDVLRRAAKVSHSTRSLLHHLFGTSEILKRWGSAHYLQRAGLFHSIYGTGSFERAVLRLSQRSLIRAIVGKRSEELVFLYCTLKLVTLRFDGKHWSAATECGKQHMLSKAVARDLMTLACANAIEQSPYVSDEGEFEFLYRFEKLLPAEVLCNLKDFMHGGLSD
jgi:hypothetical protein